MDGGAPIKCILCSKVLLQTLICFYPCRHGGVCAKCANVVIRNVGNAGAPLGCPVCKRRN